MVVTAMSVVVIAVAVIEAGIFSSRAHLVGLEQSDTQQQCQRHVAFHGPKDSGIGLDIAQLRFNGLETLLWHQIALVQKKNVPIDHLGPAHFRVQE